MKLPAGSARIASVANGFCVRSRCCCEGDAIVSLVVRQIAGSQPDCGAACGFSLHGSAGRLRGEPAAPGHRRLTDLLIGPPSRRTDSGIAPEARTLLPEDKPAAQVTDVCMQRAVRLDGREVSVLEWSACGAAPGRADGPRRRRDRLHRPASRKPRSLRPIIVVERERSEPSGLLTLHHAGPGCSVPPRAPWSSRLAIGECMQKRSKPSAAGTGTDCGGAYDIGARLPRRI